jgi:hypothetical protein
MAFRVAGCLLTLRKEVNAVAPGRSKLSDGTIGDAKHQTRKSDHNPDAQGVVRAMDLTHDPDNGADMNLLAEHLRGGRDPRLKYVIFNRRIFSPKTGFVWKQYNGENPHTKHLHISVDATDVADDGSEWGFVIMPEEEDDDMRYKLFKVAGAHNILAVGPGTPFNPGTPEVAQELVDKGQVADRDGRPVAPGTFFRNVAIEVSEELFRKMGGEAEVLIHR